MSTLKIKRENGKIFCPLADSWHIETPEEKVRQEYIKILVENYGYSLDQMAQEIKVNNSQRGQGKARADIVIWKSKQDKIESKAAFIVVECKAENVRIREEDYYQGYNYASWAGASFFVTTNEKETKYFNVDKDYLPKELVEVVAIPTAEEALNSCFTTPRKSLRLTNFLRKTKSSKLGKTVLSKMNIFAEQFGVIAVHLPKYILGQFFGKLCHIMIAIPSSWCGIELGVNGSLLKVRPNILFLNFIAPSFLARSLAGHLAAFE